MKTKNTLELQKTYGLKMIFEKMELNNFISCNLILIRDNFYFYNNLYNFYPGNVEI